MRLIKVSSKRGGSGRQRVEINDPNVAHSGIGSTSLPRIRRNSEHQEILGLSRFSANVGSMICPGTR